MSTGAKIGIAAIGLLVAIGLLIALLPFGTIDAGHRGVVKRFGKVQKVIGEGFYWYNPLTQDIIEVPVQTVKYEVDAAAASKDLQNVHSNLAINYHLVPSEVGKLYTEVGADFQNRIIAPAVQETYKTGSAKFTAEQLITHREEVTEFVEGALRKHMTKYHIVIDRVNIVNFQFSEQFDNAIEAKVKAEQEALTAEKQLARVKFEAQQKIEAAKGEAESIRVKSQALKENPQILQLNAIEKWDGVLPTYMGASAPLPFLSMQQ